MERKRRLDEAALARWEQRYWEQMIPGSGPTESQIETSLGIGHWEIGDSFIVQ